MPALSLEHADAQLQSHLLGVDNRVYNAPLRTDETPDDFEPAFTALQVRIEASCLAQPDWASGVAAGIRAALAFAAADPDAARALTIEALAAGRPGFARYQRLISYLCDLLVPGRDVFPDAELLPKETERALAGGIAVLVAQRLDTDRHTELPSLAADATQFVLTPYLGVDEARRIAQT